MRSTSTVNHLQVETFFDGPTFTLTYIVFDPKTKDAVIIDPVLDYDPLGSQTSLKQLETVSSFIREHGLTLHYVLETHAHADHLSSSQLLKQRFGARVGIGEHIRVVQETFKGIFNMGDDFATDGSQFDVLFKDRQVFSAGSLELEVINTPGHTPACVTYKIGDALFTGDALFIEDFGTGRCDFPRGSAEELYHSIYDRLYSFPDHLKVFVGHDYMPGGRPLRAETTLGAEKAANIQLTAETSKEQFVQFRTTRDKTLAPPRLIFQSVQLNANAGRLPKAESNGVRYIKLPLNLFGPTDDLGNPAQG